MNLRKPEKLIKNNQSPVIYPREETYPLIMKVEWTKEEIAAFFRKGGKKVANPYFPLNLFLNHPTTKITNNPPTLYQINFHPRNIYWQLPVNRTAKKRVRILLLIW